MFYERLYTMFNGESFFRNFEGKSVIIPSSQVNSHHHISPDDKKAIFDYLRSL